MSANNTEGFNILIQLNEEELNEQAADAFAAGGLFAPEIITDFSYGGATGTLTLNLLTPIIDLDRPSPSIGITVPFQGSQLAITAPLPLTLSPLGGTITIVDRVQVINGPGTQQAAIDFTDGLPQVVVALDAASEALLSPLLSVAGITLDQVLNQMSAEVQQRLVNDIERFPITPAIPVSSDTEDPMVVSSFEVGTVNDTSAADRDALVFGVRTGGSTGGNISQVTESFIPAGFQAMMMFGNPWLLSEVICPFLADALGVDETAFDAPCVLNRSVPMEDGTLTQLRAFIQGNRIRVEGRATASGTGWSAVSNFGFFVDLSLEGGAIVVEASEPEVDTDADLEWWVWLVSLGLGAIFGGIIGVIVAAIVTAIVEAIIGGIADNLIGDGLTEATTDIPSMPLGPIGESLSAASLLLDDMELHGSIVRSHSTPIKSAGHHVIQNGFGIDLDSGQIKPLSSNDYNCDLWWGLSTGIRAGMGVGFQILSSSYGSISQTDLEKYAYNTQSVPAFSIPFNLNIPFIQSPTLVFGVLTNEGRYSKVSVNRDFDGDLNVTYKTFDRPVPKLDIGVHWEVYEKGDVTSYTRPDCIHCDKYDVAWHGMFEAIPRLLTYPVCYQWCLCGTALTDSEGEVDTPSGTITYEIIGKRLHIWSSLGQKLDCELCVSAIDMREREFFTCVPVKKSGIETKCCTPRTKNPGSKIAIEKTFSATAMTQWESVSGVAFNGQLKAAIENPRKKKTVVEG